MERLTKWNGEKWVLPQGRTSEGKSYWREIAERLAEYENTGLTPDGVIRMQRTFDSLAIGLKQQLYRKGRK